MKNIKPPHRGLFFTINENGEITDIGLFEEMLANEAQIRKDLIRFGVIREFTGRMLREGEDSSNPASFT